MDCAVARHFDADQVILREGEFANGFYLIETGKVALESKACFGESILLQTIGAGDMLGWSWMFPPYVWQFTARAVEPTATLFFYAAILREILREGPLVRLRASEADKCRDGDTLTGFA